MNFQMNVAGFTPVAHGIIAPSTIRQDKTETIQATITGFTPGVLVGGTRMNGADAYDRHSNGFEFKATTKKSGSVSTARDLGWPWVAKMAQRYWFISRGTVQDGEVLLNEHFFLAPVHMDGWIASALEPDFNRAAQLRQFVIERMGGETDFDLDLFERLIRRGMTKNDPCIPWGYIKANGKRLSSDLTTLRAELDDLVHEYPIDGRGASRYVGV